MILVPQWQKGERNSDFIIGVSFFIQIFIPLFQRKIFRNYTRSDLLHILIKYTAKPPLIIQDTLFWRSNTPLKQLLKEQILLSSLIICSFLLSVLLQKALFLSILQSFYFSYDLKFWILVNSDFIRVKSTCISFKVVCSFIMSTCLLNSSSASILSLSLVRIHHKENTNTKRLQIVVGFFNRSSMVFIF